MKESEEWKKLMVKGNFPNVVVLPQLDRAKLALHNTFTNTLYVSKAIEKFLKMDTLDALEYLQVVHMPRDEEGRDVLGGPAYVPRYNSIDDWIDACANNPKIDLFHEDKKND